jgi:hypothetical protein
VQPPARAAVASVDRERSLELSARGGLEWKEDMVRTARRKNGIARVAHDRPRMRPLPHQHPDGRYSVPGAAARFGLSRNVVRSWIKQGSSRDRADFGTHRGVCSLDIDDVTAARLVARGRVRRKRGKA